MSLRHPRTLGAGRQQYGAGLGGGVAPGEAPADVGFVAEGNRARGRAG